MPAMATPATPLEPGAEMFQRSKTTSFLQMTRPLSQATEILDTDFEEESEFEEEYSPKGSFESDDSRRRSQTTVSSYDEVPTPRSSRDQRMLRRPFELRLKPVEGPRGPHLFRSSQSSAEFVFEEALQLSPLLPKAPPERVGTAFTDQTLTQPLRPSLSIAAALAHPEHNTADSDDAIRAWNPTQVIDWLLDSGLDSSVIECFERHDINGNVLMDLQFEDLRELDIQSFGKRHSLWNAICNLRGIEGGISPSQTPFQDITRPCTRNTGRSLSRNGRTTRRSPSRGESACQTPVDGDATPVTPSAHKKRRGRKASKGNEIVTPAESVSIVAIEQLMPKPHQCAKGERCSKWRKQQRQLKQLQDEHGIGRFPVSPKKGGRIFIAGDPGNATTAGNIVPNVHKQPEAQVQSDSVVIPSVVASSDLLGPGQLPEFALHEEMLQQLGNRDPQDNVRHFLTFQHLQSPVDHPPTPPEELAAPDSIPRSSSVPLLFPDHHHQAYPSLYPPRSSSMPLSNLRSLPRLEIPRSQSAQPYVNSCASPETATSICRSATTSPAQVFRHGTPASEMDVPITAVPTGPVSRDTSQSVPPNMQYRQPTSVARSHSTRTGGPEWRRPSLALPAVKEGEVYSPATSPEGRRSGPGGHKHGSSAAAVPVLARSHSVRDPAHDDPATQYFGYGADCTHAGWMRKRKTRMLRHEWQDAHFRLKGTELAMHPSARLSAAATDTINVEKYAVACSSVASGNKLSAAMKAFHLRAEGKEGDAGAFAFQLVPSKDAKSKTHHFAVRSKDERIDWMREIMLSKALRQKDAGFEVEVNGRQA